MASSAHYIGRSSEVSLDAFEYHAVSTPEKRVVAKMAEVGMALVQERSEEAIMANVLINVVVDGPSMTANLTVAFAETSIAGEQMEGEARRQKAGQEILGS